MIRNFKEFILESYSEDTHHSLGEYIEDLANKNEYIRMIVGQMTGDINPSIRLSNAINILDDISKVELLKRVENHLDGIEGEVSIAANVLVNINETYGKGVLNTFFKCITALGFKNNSPESEVPNEFLFFFKISNIESEKLKGVFNRFKSLQAIQINYNGAISLYFGIKCDGNFEYGYYHDNLIPIGIFRLDKSILNKIKTSELKSTSGLKKSLTELSLEDIKLMGKIKVEMNKFNPGYFEQKMTPKVNERIISFGLYGFGKWENGKLDINEFEIFKGKLKEFLSKYKWSEKIQISINPSNFWTYIQIKLK